MLFSECLRDLEQVRGAVLIGNDERTPGLQIEIGGAGLDGELVKRHVAFLFAQGPRQLVFPLRRCLLRPRINHVEGDARKNLCGQTESLERLVGRMLAAQRLQVSFIERLHPNRHAVHSRRAVAPEISASTLVDWPQSNFNRTATGQSRAI